MEIRNPLVLRGPNIWATFPVMEVWLDVGEWKNRPIGTFAGFAERLLAWMPGMNRTWTEDRPPTENGIESHGSTRIHTDAADAGEVEVSVARAFLEATLEFERETGGNPDPYQRVEAGSEPGLYLIVFRYREENLTKACLNEALAIITAAAEGREFDVAAAIERVRAEAVKRLPSPGTQAVADAALSRNIPVIHLDNTGLLQLGYGARQRRIRAGETDRTGAIAHSVAEDKGLTRRLLQSVGVPTPNGYEVTDTEDAWKTAEYVGLPAVVKPGFGTGGRGVTTNLKTREEVAAAYQAALEESSTVLVERQVAGRRYQMLVVGGKMVSTIRLDADGPKDVTQRAHPEVEARAATAARAAGLDVAGIDIVAQNISIPLEKQEGAIVDIHASPKLDAHVSTPEGRTRAGQAFVGLLFPPGEDGRIPIAAVTGTNGKTTVTRFLAHILQGTGRQVGMSCTDGIYVNERRISKGDCSGPASARSVLMNPVVQVAVCETARGGILRAGLAFDECQVAVVTNIAGGDHLGIHEIHTPEDLARVKRTIVEVVSLDGTAVLNAADPLVAEMKERCRGRVVYFALDGRNAAIVRHRAAGGQALFVRGKQIVLATGEREQDFTSLERIPLTFGGRIAFEVENALAAIGAALALGVDRHTIIEQASNFATDLDTVPTRFNVFETRGATVVVDFGHNPDALRAVVTALETFPQKRRVAVYSSAGDRRDADILAMGEMLGNAFDRVILYEDTDRYKRAPGEITALLRQGLAAGSRVKEIEEIEGGLNAFRHAWETVQPGELLLAQAHTADPTVEYLKKKETERS